MALDFSLAQKSGGFDIGKYRQYSTEQISISYHFQYRCFSILDDYFGGLVFYEDFPSGLPAHRKNRSGRCRKN